jgi:hypothetical protein
VAPLFAAAAFVALRRRFGLPPARAAAGTAAAIALSGLALFDLVTPRLLPASHLDVTLRVLQAAAPPGGALALDYEGAAGVDWLHVARIARHVPHRPLPVRSLEDDASLLQAPGRPEPAAEVFFYSPALEHDRRVGLRVCGLWPGAALYRFTDRAGLSHALAARPAGPGWEPVWPAGRFEVRRCE